MHKEMFKNILIVLLLTLTVFSVFKYIHSLKQKYDLLHTLNEVKEQVAALESQKQNLLQELDKGKELQQRLTEEKSGLKDYLRASKKRLTQVFADYRGLEKANAELHAQFSILKAENTALREEKEQVADENEGLKAKFNSIIELKKAIQELKRQARKVTREMRQKTPVEKMMEGNRGFLIKDGQFTYPAKVKIEVIPASKKE